MSFSSRAGAAVAQPSLKPGERTCTQEGTSQQCSCGQQHGIAVEVNSIEVTEAVLLSTAREGQRALRTAQARAGRGRAGRGGAGHSKDCTGQGRIGQERGRAELQLDRGGQGKSRTGQGKIPDVKGNAQQVKRQQNRPSRSYPA